MGNYLKMADKQRILSLLELGWSYRWIARETGASRETVARYDPRRSPKPARVSTGPQNAAEPYRAFIETGIARGLTAHRIWQDLKEDYCFSHGYCVRQLISLSTGINIDGYQGGLYNNQTGAPRWVAREKCR